MTTATPTRTLEETITERALEKVNEYPGELDVIRSGIAEMVSVVIGDWSQWENEHAEQCIGEAWIEAARKQLRDIGNEAVLRQVIPAMAAAAEQYLRDNPPPAHLIAFDGSDVLRADLAALETDR